MPPIFNNNPVTKKAGKAAAKIRPLSERRIRTGQTGIPLGMMLSYMSGRSFTYSDVPAMLEDDQVKLGMEYLTVPIGNVPIQVKTGDPSAYGYALDLTKRVWNALTPKLSTNFAYGWCCYEPLYKLDIQKLWDFSDFEIAPPMASQPWVYQDKLAFVAVDMQGGSFSSANYIESGTMPDPERCIIMEGAGEYRPTKALWLANDPTVSRWFGVSVLRAAHVRWKAKGMPDGALETMLKAMYRASFSGVVIRYPAQQTVIGPDGAERPTEEYADFLCQVIKSGTNIRLPDKMEGQPGWDVASYNENLVDVGKLIPGLDYLDRGIHRGMGIPDEIVTHQGNTGGYSRSLVSIDAFYSRGEARARYILQRVLDDIVAPLVRMRFNCDTTAEVLKQPRPGEGQQGGMSQDGQNDGSMYAGDQDGGDAGAQDQQQGDQDGKSSIVAGRAPGAIDSRNVGSNMGGSTNGRFSAKLNKLLGK